MPFRAVEDVLGPEGLSAADGAARTWARVWGRLPLREGKSFRELVPWRGSSLLWSVSGSLLEETAAPRCARTAELALRLLEATAPPEVDASGLAPPDTLLLAGADLDVLLEGHLPAAVARIEAAVELVGAAGAAAVLVAVPGRDERRALVHACSAAGVGAVVVRPGATVATDAVRADGGPQPLATLDWEPGGDSGPVLARLREAARGRVGAE